MFSLIPFAAREFLGKWWPAILAFVVILIAVGVIYTRGVSAGKTGEQLKNAKEDIIVVEKVTEANTAAAEQRVEDATRLQDQAQEIKDATRDAKDLDDARRKRGCVILRQQGKATDKIPACR